MHPIRIENPELLGTPISLAEDQPQYVPIHGVLVDEQTGAIITRWEFTDEEREAIARGGVMEARILTFGKGVQPMSYIILDPA